MQERRAVRRIEIHDAGKIFLPISEFFDNAFRFKVQAEP